MKNTLLATMWATEGSVSVATETVLGMLESGELELTGNFRNVPRDGWRKEVENDG